MLKGAAQLMRERVEHIARIATLEEGKTLAETRIEAMVTADLFEFYGEECRRTLRAGAGPPDRHPLARVKEPVGPVAAFAPWNFPIGNPGPQARRAHCRGLLGDPQAGRGSARLGASRSCEPCSMPACRRASRSSCSACPTRSRATCWPRRSSASCRFTGSTAVGKHLLTLAADDVQAHDHGAGRPRARCMVFDDADLDAGARTCSRPPNSATPGRCASRPPASIVQEGIYDRFVDGFTERAAR